MPHNNEEINCAVVPRLLTDCQRSENRLMARRKLQQIYQELGETFGRAPSLQTRLGYCFTCPTQRDSRNSCANDHRPLKAKTVPSAGKVMITMFWEWGSLIFIDYLEKGDTTNSHYFSSTLCDELHTSHWLTGSGSWLCSLLWSRASTSLIFV